MRDLLKSEIAERLFFTALVIGIALSAYAALRYVSLSQEIDANWSAQVQESGGEVAIASKAEAQGLMASDIERRRLEAQRYNMMVVGGAGLALLGLGWLGYDFIRGGRRRGEGKQQDTEANQG